MDEDIAEVVRMARAVLAMEERLRRAQETVTARDRQVAELRAAALSASGERMQLLNRIFAVTRLHTEATVVSCGDGCCHEGTGVCEYDDEPWPCVTYRATRSEDEHRG